MKDILTRSLSGLVFIIAVLSSIYFGLKPFFIVSLFFVIVALFEYNRFFQNDEKTKFPLGIYLVVGILLYGINVAELFDDSIQIDFLTYPIMFATLLIELWRKDRDVIKANAAPIFGYIYVIVPFVLMNRILADDDLGSKMLFVLFILVWANDSFAYLSGRLFGKTKLFERISPKKTWEGTIGGVLMTVVFSIVFFLLFEDRQLYFYLLASALICVASILGDLFESLIKRNLNIKDSGSIMPGHGGILDRFDAVLFAAPFFYSWCLIYDYIC